MPFPQRPFEYVTSPKGTVFIAWGLLEEAISQFVFGLLWLPWGSPDNPRRPGVQNSEFACQGRLGFCLLYTNCFLIKLIILFKKKKQEEGTFYLSVFVHLSVFFRVLRNV